MPDFRFNLPTLGQLKPEQQIALFNNDHPNLVTGGPGSGKTVVSVRRLLRLTETNEKVKLFTFNRTLMAAIRALARTEGFDSNIVDSFYDWYYNNTNGLFEQESELEISNRFKKYSEDEGKFDNVIIDEAQDFKPQILSSLKHLSVKIFAGADKDQLYREIPEYLNGDPETIIRNILSSYQTNFGSHLLEQNHRNTREIFAFARCFVPNNPRPWQVDLNSLPAGDIPEMFDNLSEQQQLNKIKEIVLLNQANSNIGILVHIKSQIDLVRNYLRGNDIVHSYYYKGMNQADQNATEERLQTPFIATFASCKGLEFDIVILPFFEISNWSMNKGQATAKHYYVAATRARKQLFVFYNQKPNILANFGKPIHEENNGLYKLNGQESLFNF